MANTGTKPSSTAPRMMLVPQNDDTQPSLIDSIPIQLEPDRERQLICDFEVMDEIQKKMGICLWRAGTWAELTGDPIRLSEALAFFLKRDDPTITADQVRRMRFFNLPNMTYILARINMLWGATMVEVKEPETNGDAAATSEVADPNQTSALPTSTATSEPSMG